MFNLTRGVLPLLAGIALLYGCAETNLPPITDSPTNTYRTGEIVWRDLVTKDASASAKFYSDVFGWKVSKSEGAVPDYYTITNRGELIGGILQFPEKSRVDGNEWLSTMSARDIAGASASITANGGQVMTEAQDVPGRGEYIIAVDPSGGILALLDADGGDPAQSKSAENDWLWSELWSNDPESVQSFYGAFGYTFKKETDDDRDYWIMKAGDSNVGGVMQNPVDNTRSMWLPYIHVADVSVMSDRVTRFGGRVISGPSDDIRNGTLALCVDPLGGFFAIQEWSN